MPAPTNARAARERKQKIFVAAGGVVLLLLLAIQLPKLLGGSESTAAGETGTTTTVAGEPTSTTETSTPSTGAPTPTSVSIALTDTDRPLPVGPGQFRSFSAFDRKDPFVQKVKTPGSSPSESGDGSGSSGSSADGDPKSPSKEDTPSQGFNVDGTSAAAVTVISVNGVRQALEPGAAFPAADPVFVLVAENPAAKTAVIGVRGGAYASGARTTRLKVGKPLVLVNTTTGARYRVVLVAVGTTSGSPAAPDQSSPTAPTTP